MAGAYTLYFQMVPLLQIECGFSAKTVSFYSRFPKKKHGFKTLNYALKCKQISNNSRYINMINW